jgi:hypothetical protein
MCPEKSVLYELEAGTKKEAPLPGFRASPLKVSRRGMIASLPKSPEPED